LKWLWWNFFLHWKKCLASHAQKCAIKSLFRRKFVERLKRNVMDAGVFLSGGAASFTHTQRDSWCMYRDRRNRKLQYLYASDYEWLMLLEIKIFSIQLFITPALLKLNFRFFWMRNSSWKWYLFMQTKVSSLVFEKCEIWPWKVIFGIVLFVYFN